VTVHPGDDVETRRRDLSKTWNFVLPRAWTNQPPIAGGPFWLYLEARVSAPLSQPECPGCDDEANRIRVAAIEFHAVPSFSASLVRQLRVRRERPSTGGSYTPPAANVVGPVDFIRKTYPVDETTVSSLMSILTVNHEDSGNNVFCDHNAMRAAYPTNAADECCDDGFRIVATYIGGDLDGDGNPDCRGGGLGWSDGYAATMLSAAPSPGSYPTMAQEMGHANGTSGTAPRGGHRHAGPPPGHGNECFAPCSDFEDWSTTTPTLPWARPSI
jgi:hypothetical protein